MSWLVLRSEASALAFNLYCGNTMLGWPLGASLRAPMGTGEWMDLLPESLGLGPGRA
jgi:hypothetical protein